MIPNNGYLTEMAEGTIGVTPQILQLMAQELLIRRRLTAAEQALRIADRQKRDGWEEYLTLRSLEEELRNFEARALT